MKEFYEKNKDFKEYVDKYCAKNHIPVDEALTHALVREAYVYYLSIDDK